MRTLNIAIHWQRTRKSQHREVLDIHLGPLGILHEIQDTQGILYILGAVHASLSRPNEEEKGPERKRG